MDRPYLNETSDLKLFGIFLCKLILARRADLPFSRASFANSSHFSFEILMKFRPVLSDFNRSSERTHH